jgi:hypothetical protein
VLQGMMSPAVPATWTEIEDSPPPGGGFQWEASGQDRSEHWEDSAGQVSSRGRCC